MITTVIGRTFLNAYNKTYQKSYTPKEFFDKVYFELFFNHPKYMMWAQNSPFVQMRGVQKPENLTSVERLEKLENLHQKIIQGDRDASIAIGFPASEDKEFATTSGSVTDMVIEISDEDVYYTWIGSSLSIGIAGGFSLLFNDEQILLDIYRGWEHYRHFLNDEAISKIRGNQIITWNGQWLNYFYSSDFRENFDFTTLENAGIFTQDATLIQANTIKWSKLFFNLSKHYSDRVIPGYIFGLGQTNKTLGFYPFHFKQGRKLIHIYRQLFGENDSLKDAKDYEALFGIHIKRACELGAIGLQALEPEGLRKYFTEAKLPNFAKPSISLKKTDTEDELAYKQLQAEQKDYNQNIIPFRTFKTWLVAMITKNKEEILDYTAEVAAALHEYKKATTRTDRGNLIKSELLVAKTKKAFLDCLSDVIKDVATEKLELFKGLRDRVHLMTHEDFGYFVVLLKFDYAFQERT
ncbi:hypothetical protein [Williamwhitmania taraxaci]|uniref:Uncharacterized protein n=1 Tax=Williamwhitmania taraxaci TaxID=1640674 RepID=A0A1G6N3P4_9BACT|nr:hypothetical protein [Williamwhitmania taraxaci]SDC62450.1 hypothetical protein SAMN05216323_104025 [Williamwhitmania taraxaci]